MTAGNIRVGFVLHVMQVAGAEVLVREIIRRLGPRIQPTILCLDGVGAIGEQLRAEGVAVMALGRRPGRDWRLVRRIARIVRERRIELLHAHQYSPLFYAALAKVHSGCRTKLLFTEHGRHYPDRVSGRRNFVNRLFFDRVTDAATAVCAFTKRSLIEVEGFSARRIQIIANGIEADRYGRADDQAEVKRSLGLDPARRYVIKIARFHPVKDHGTLLRAFCEVAAVRRDVDLLLAGDGPGRADAEKLAAELGICQRVRFLGVRGDVPELLQASDLFTLTSVSEAASLTLLEAMAAGLPCVVTNVGGNPELVRDGFDGLLVPRADWQATSRAMLHILDRPQLAVAMGAAGAHRVRQQFLLEQTINAYWQLYQGLVGRAGSRPRATEDVAEAGLLPAISRI